MKFPHLLLTIILSVLVTLGTLYAAGTLPKTGPTQTAAKETRWEHIKRTGVLRCGYLSWPPVLDRDPNTGKMSGIMYDLVEEIGKRLSLKIEWTGEVAPAHIFTDLALNRYDAICMAFYITPERAREGSFTTNILYWPTYLYARASDTRFDNDYAKANDPRVTFATMDGDFSAVGAREHFPKAKTSSVPEISSSADLFNLIVSKKADLIVTEPLTFLNYLKNNPGTVRQVKGSPVYVGATAMPLPPKETDLKEVIDESIVYLQGTGFIEGLLKKYETPGLKFLRLAKPYEEPKP
jgi:polar amino acid transport system substrate-binding protein